MRHRIYVKLILPPIYPITDSKISGLSIPEQVRKLIAGGAKLIQIRDKTSSSRDFVAAAEEAIKIARQHDVQAMINDRVDLALLLNADGVHLGQEDLSPEHARRILGPNAIIGYSTHNFAQAKEALKMPVDYIAFGPVFSTSTKQNPDPVVGLDLLSRIKSVAGEKPLVAIGGITRANVCPVLEAGADSAAIINGILSTPEQISENLAALISLADDKQRLLELKSACIPAIL